MIPYEKCKRVSLSLSRIISVSKVNLYAATCTCLRRKLSCFSSSWNVNERKRAKRWNYGLQKERMNGTKKETAKIKESRKKKHARGLLGIKEFLKNIIKSIFWLVRFHLIFNVFYSSLPIFVWCILMQLQWQWLCMVMEWNCQSVRKPVSHYTEC